MQHQCGEMDQHNYNLFLHRIDGLTHNHCMYDSPQKINHGDLTYKVTSHPLILREFTIKKIIITKATTYS